MIESPLSAPPSRGSIAAWPPSCAAWILVLSFYWSLLGGFHLAAWGAEPVAVGAEHAAEMRAGLQLFRESVRTILEQRCVRCHIGDDAQGDFDLSDRDTFLASGFAERPAAQSHLLAVLKHEVEPFMPQKSAKLSHEQIELISRWIDLGAPFDRPLGGSDRKSPAAGEVSDYQRQFWSFQPLSDHGPPLSDDGSNVHPVDAFIAAELREHELKPNAEATRSELIRRAYLDLLGLPPTPLEVEQFVTDADPQAYEHLIDRLLASPHYGERWARHWMDVARFGESCGFEHDNDRAYAYHYRDFLIRALNEDLPYDQFVQWQLAGDELALENPLAWMATGFLSAGVFPTQITEAEFETVRYDELDDMVSTVGSAFLGLSVGCARCHDHKFDPIPSRDYYRLLANFATTIRSEIPLTVTPTTEPSLVQVASENVPHVANHADGRGYPHFYETVHVLQRGSVEQKGEVASPGFLQILMPPGRDCQSWQVPPSGPARTSMRRAALARWITDPQEGAGMLAARVMVNRLWQHHFGRGIVATPNDFGLQGERPTHPELLDWLARQLIDGQWRLKPIHRLIMTSQTYRQSTASDEERLARDPYNRTWWRQSPRRLEGEAIRDSMLAVSGLLDRTPYGPGTLDRAMRRRSVYFFVKRSQLIPEMMLFDWPEHLVSQGERASTTTAPQALFFLNSPQGRVIASSFASRVHTKVQQSGVPADKPGYSDAWIADAFRWALSRHPSPRELEVTQRFLDQQTQTYIDTAMPAAGVERQAARQQAEIDFCQMLLSSNEFCYRP